MSSILSRAAIWCCLLISTLVCTVQASSSLIVTYENQHISALAFSPDGHTIACGLRGSPYPDDNAPGIVDLRETKTGLLLRRLTCGFGELNSIAFSPDGRLIAATVGTGGWRMRSDADPPYPRVLGEAYLWEVKTGKLKQKLTISSGQAISIAFSPDGRYAAVGSGDTTVRLWDLSLGKSKWVVTAQAAYVSSVAFSLDGKTVLTGNWDESIRLWNTSDGKLKRSLTPENFEGGILAIAVSSRNMLASAGNDRLRIWNLKSGKMVRVLGEREPISGVLFSPNGKLVAAKGTWGGVTVWNWSKGELIKEIETRAEAALDFTPDSQALAVSDSDSRTPEPYQSTIKLHRL